MAANKLYGLSEDYTELNTVVKKSQQNTEDETSADHGPVYENTTLQTSNGLSPSEEHYAALQDVQDAQTVEDQSKDTDVPKPECNQKEERWIYFVYASFFLSVALFVAVIGMGITLGITISGTKESKEMLSSLLKSGMWSDWESWTQCSVTCGLGSTYRNRTCSANDGTYCKGNTTEFNICHITPCPAIDGGWSDWTSWRPCSVTCSTGLQSRLRTCTNPRPCNGGDLCFGESSEYRLCNNGICAVNITWSEWGSWSKCSASCDFGIQHRVRTCSVEDENIGSTDCDRNDTEYRLCNEASCSVNNTWSEWGSWSTCSASCDFGIQYRVRTCTVEDENIGLTDCDRNDTEYRHCHEASCAAVNGGWSAWSAWGPCSGTCDTGLQSRHRTCSNPKPSNEGEQCSEEPSNYRLCKLTNCTVTNGQWAYWSSWSSCSSTCTKTRSRTCTSPLPSTYGRMCEGNSKDQENCNVQTCAMQPLRIRLVGGSSTSGRLEVSADGLTWGTVCDDSFDSNDAIVACRMLGYSGSGVISSSSVPDGTGPIFLDDLACTGSESSFSFCRHSGWGIENCGHHEDVGVSC